MAIYTLYVNVVHVLDDDLLSSSVPSTGIQELLNIYTTSPESAFENLWRLASMWQLLGMRLCLSLCRFGLETSFIYIPEFDRASLGSQREDIFKVISFFFLPVQPRERLG